MSWTFRKKEIQFSFAESSPISPHPIGQSERDMAPTEFAANYIPRKLLAKELGQRLRGKPYSEFTLIAWEKDGKGPPVTRIGRDVVYSIPSVDKWLRAQERAAKGSISANAA
jgi:hypothetical protein